MFLFLQSKRESQKVPCFFFFLFSSTGDICKCLSIEPCDYLSKKSCICGGSGKCFTTCAIIKPKYFVTCKEKKLNFNSIWKQDFFLSTYVVTSWTSWTPRIEFGWWVWSHLLEFEVNMSPEDDLRMYCLKYPVNKNKQHASIWIVHFWIWKKKKINKLGTFLDWQNYRQ